MLIVLGTIKFLAILDLFSIIGQLLTKIIRKQGNKGHIMKNAGIHLGNLILRISFGGLILLGHGLSKIQMLMAGNFEQFPDPIGWGSTMSLIGATFAEGVCSALIILGLFTRIASIPLIINMSVAALMVHAHDPIFPQHINNVGGYNVLLTPFNEYALLYGFAFLTILFQGGGAFSLDRVFFRKK